MTTTWGRENLDLPAALLGPARELAACALDVLVQGLPAESDPPARRAGSAAQGTACPVILVHGYGGTKTQWYTVRRALGDAGFGCVRTFEYDARTTDIPTLAARLGWVARSLLAETGAARVHLVGHSLGGVVIRYAVARLDLDPLVGAVVTIASPHGGCPAAWAGTGTVAAQLRPGSPLLRELDAVARSGQARWLALYGDLDAVVPAASARLRPAALEAANTRVPGEGHLSILWSRRVSAAVTDHLQAADAAHRAPRADCAPRADLAA